MLRRFFSVAVLCALSVQFSGVAHAAVTPFPDTVGRWYRYNEAIDYLKNKGVISGYEDGNFHPTDTINRAEFVKLVFKNEAILDQPERRCFSDVNPREWFAPYVCTAKDKGVVSGYRDGTFKAADPVNTAEAIKMVMQANGFTVTPRTGIDWYQPYTEELDAKGILSEHSYIPWDPLTRERAADLLWRVMRYKQDRIRSQESPGCGQPQPSGALHSVVVNGTTRDFLLTSPAHVTARTPSPLIIAFHGRTNSNQQVRSYFRLDSTFPQAYIAYPAALSNGNGTFSWSNPGDKASTLRDIALFDALVEKLANTYCIDMDDIMVVGHSLGAWFANSLACVRGGVIKASATVGGDSVQTTCSGPSSALIAFNPKDTTSAFSSAERARDLRIATNHCVVEPQNDDGADLLSCVQYAHCAGGTAVYWCPHTLDKDERGVFYPHNWPRGTASEIDDFYESLK